MKFILSILIFFSIQSTAQLLKPDNDVLLPGNRQYFTVSGATDSAVSYCTIAGQKAIRFTLSKDYPDYEEGYRSELGFPFFRGQQNQTVTFQTFFPGNSVPVSSQRFGVWDFHDMPDFSKGESWCQPPITAYIENNHLFVFVVWAKMQLQTEGSITYDLGEIERDKWVDWKIQVHFSQESTGILRIRKNGALVVKYTGPNTLNRTYFPSFKCGIYNWLGWKVLSYIQLYFANIVVR